MYQRKTKDVWILQGYYAGYWEELFTEESYKEAKIQLRCYNENEAYYPHRIIKKRIPLNSI